MISTGEFAAGVVMGVGALLFWANPRRHVNRAVFGCSAIVSTWLEFTNLALSDTAHGLFWMRWAMAAGGLAPLSLWLVRESIVGAVSLRSPKWYRDNLLWILTSLFLFAVPFTEIFIPSYSTDLNRVFGPGYWAYYASVIALYVKLIWDSVRALTLLTGAKKVELQVWLCGGSLIAVLIYVLIGLQGLTHDQLYKKLQPIAVLIFYGGTAYAITSNRLFDARQILLVGIEKLLLIGLASSAAFGVTILFSELLSDAVTLVLSTAIVVVITGKLGRWLDKKFRFVPRAESARREAFATAQRERRVGALEESFMQLLKGWGQTETAVVISGAGGTLSGRGIELVASGHLVETMKSLHWATPERLARERQTPGRVLLEKFLSNHNLGALLFEQGASLTVLVGVGIAASRRPYTYPEVTQLMELVSIIQGALERAHFSAKAQHAEQLATVGILGASVAHEIRNPLVSIKTFVQLLPTHYSDENFRNKFFKLIGDEVARIDQLTEQLLDLSSPRAYSAQFIELHSLLRAGLDLVAAKAAHRHVELITEFNAQPDRAFTDASAAKQVILNLCFNAIQAVEAHDADDRWIKISTRNLDRGIEMAVADSGPGIAPEILPRLFQPFQTTKSTGFGLGLATCSDILNNLHASIKVDPPIAGQGAIFRVVFPCQPLSS